MGISSHFLRLVHHIDLILHTMKELSSSYNSTIGDTKSISSLTGEMWKKEGSVGRLEMYRNKIIFWTEIEFPLR